MHFSIFSKFTSTNLRPLCSTKYVHIKSTTVYVSRQNWDSPNRRLVCLLPLVVLKGEEHWLARKWVKRVPIPTREIHCGTLYM